MTKLNKLKCPFDKKCDKCHLNTKMFETVNGESKAVYKCAIYWTPILLSEISMKLDKKDKKE